MRKADSNLKYRIFSLFLTIYKILHNQLHSTSVDLIFTNVLHKKSYCNRGHFQYNLKSLKCLSAICSNPVKWKTQSVTQGSRIQSCHLRRSCFFSQQTQKTMYYIDLCVPPYVCKECGARFFFTLQTTQICTVHRLQSYIKKNIKASDANFPIMKAIL